MGRSLPKKRHSPATDDPRPSAAFSTRKHPRRISENASPVLSRSAASHPATAPSPRHEGFLRQAPRTVALVPAAGRGHRMGHNTPKQFLTLGGLPLLVHSLRVLEASEVISSIVLAVPQADLDYCQRDIVDQYGFKKVRRLVAGGAERQDSVRLGLAAVEPDAEIVLIHDAVRPFLTESMIAKVVEAAAKHGAAIVAIPMRDTVKRAGADGLIDETVDRKPLWLAQTPQAFRRALLAEAHAKARQSGFRATDDAQLVERLGHRVAIVEGSTDNIKMTRPEDLAMGESILASRKKGNQ